MIKLLRNPEFRKEFILFTAIAAAASTAAFLWDLLFGVFTIFLCAVFLAVFCIGSYRRYKTISNFSADIDRVLHGNRAFPLDRYSEGELAILQTEIHKMTVRLAEQNQSLKNEKLYLANSLANISHQIRTPLTSINLLVSFLSDPNITPERRQKVSHELYTLLARIDWLITALLKISKLDAGTVQFKAEDTSLSELLEKSVAPLLVPTELRNQTVKISADGGFSGDIAWTSEALTNIIKNCMEHTPDGGKIDIAATENPLFSEIVIADNGSGILPSDLPHIFERFYKGQNSDKNSFGIGLALSRTIITSQNGTVKAENRPSGGAKFTIRFYKGTV